MATKDDLAELYLEKQKHLNELSKDVYLNNLFALNKDILKVEEGTDEKGDPKAKLNVHHKDLCNIVQHGKNKQKLILMPRGHLKSTLVTVGYSLQRIAKNPNIRILIGNATSTMAESFLGQIKNHIKFNQDFISLFGDLSEDAEAWSNNMISLKTEEKRYESKEATVTAYGIGGNLVSQHYDLIILDDLHNRDNTATKDQIEKVKLKFKDVLDLLEPSGELIVIGTRWHYDDLYGWLMDQDNPISRRLDIYVRRAVVDGKIIEQPGGGYEILGGEILWPEKYNRDHLNDLLDSKGLYEFNKQYQNRPIDDENAVFQRKWFKDYDHTEMKDRRLIKFTAIDPAISLKERADFTAIITIGVDVHGNIYILDIRRGHFSEERIANELFLVNRKYRPISITIETVAFQKALQHFLEREMRTRGEHLPLKEVVPESDESKEKRIRSLQPYYMRGSIYHNKHVAYIDYLTDELLRFPKGKNDDIIDALAYAVGESFPPKRRTKERRVSRHLY